MVRGTLIGVRCAATLALAALFGAVGTAGAESPAGRESPDARSGAPDPDEAENGMAELGEYEREALREALERRGLELVPDPDGKVVSRIHVVNLEALSDELGALAWLNNLRYTTREHVIEREVLLRPGDPWDQETVAETRRNLTESKYSGLVVIRPVRPAGGAKVAAAGSGADGRDDGGEGEEPRQLGEGEVDLLVVTRDLWSLRAAAAFEVQQQALSALYSSVAETNFLGRRIYVGARFTMDLGEFSLGPRFLDPNVAGSRIAVEAYWASAFSRETGELEGSRSIASVAYPLWSLDREWGASISFRHDDSVARSYEAGELRRYDAPETPDDDALPWEYDRREVETASEVVRSFSGDLMHRVGLGHELWLSRPALLDEFPGDAVQRAAFERDVLPRSERTSALYVRYRLFEPRYVLYRNLDTYDLVEEFRLGPDLQLQLLGATPAVGSEATFLRARTRLEWTAGIGEDGIASAVLESDARLQSGELIDNEVLGELSAATPRLFDIGRVVARLDASARIRETQNRFYELGGLSGLRGYPIGQFTGVRRVRLNVEARTVGVPLWVARGGLVAFWDAGHAADRVRDLSLRHDVGVGFRLLTPQFSRSVFRVDWAVPLNGETAGFPGRITAGSSQVF